MIEAAIVSSTIDSQWDASGVSRVGPMALALSRQRRSGEG